MEYWERDHVDNILNKGVDKNRRRHEKLHCNSRTDGLVGYYGFIQLKIFLNVDTKISQSHPKTYIKKVFD
jgi:hypothetical protein